MTGTKKKRRTPPKHLCAASNSERCPARPSDRAEHPAKAGMEQQGSASAVPGPAHVNAGHVPQTPDNTWIFYEKLLPLAQRSHKLNQRRMHTGVVWLFALPVLLYIVRNLTDSSKIAFLILWIVGMFLIAAFLVMVAYQDDELQKNLDELQDYVPDAEETKLGKLMLVSPESNRWMEESTMQLLRRVEALTAKKPGREETSDA